MASLTSYRPMPRTAARLGRLAVERAMGLDDEFRLSLTEIRRAVEPAAAGLAARRRTPAHIASLRGQLELMARPGQERRSFAEADLDLHLENTLNIQVAIVDAIEARDEAGAAAALLQAINIGVRRIDDSGRGRAQSARARSER